MSSIDCFSDLQSPQTDRLRKQRKSCLSSSQIVQGELRCNGPKGFSFHLNHAKLVSPMKVTRTAKLAIYPNFGKLEGARYTYERHLQYTKHFVTQLYFNHHVKSFSTKGMGQLANQAHRKAQGVLKAHFAATEETGNKSSCPRMRKTGCPAQIEETKDSKFDYWLSVENTFEKCKKIYLPVKAHKRLNQWLRRGYMLNSSAELHKDKNGKFYALVFLQKDVAVAKTQDHCLGIDVGIRNSVVTSNGYFGKSLEKPLEKARDKRAERQRQGHQSKVYKTHIKQLLDIEAKRLVTRCLNRNWSLAIENPKVLANLQPKGKVAAWAKTYFSKRVMMLAEEKEVFVWCVNPAYTSLTCGNCHRVSQYMSQKSRDGRLFRCPYCRMQVNADLNGSLNIAHKGRLKMDTFLSSRSGRVKMVPICCPGWIA